MAETKLHQKLIGVIATGIAVILAVGFSAACSNKLTSEEAQRVVAAYPKAAEAGTIIVDGVSQGDGATEAIARVAIGDSHFNAKFRRYDKGWQWESVETNGGMWLAAERAVADVSEQQRVKRAAAWAAERAPQYETTIAAMDLYGDTGNMPRRTDWNFTIVEWQRLRAMAAHAYRTFSPTPERLKIAEAHSNPAKDAWGHEVLLNFDNSKRQATFLSVGPDGVKGTDDDVISLVVGRKNWDDDYDKIMWDYTKTWRLPEGLQPVLDKVIEKPENRKAEFSKAVK
jgi:hypothetical protein